MATKHRYIVAVDFGTTYSGVAHVDSTKTSINDVHVIRNWPGPTKEFDEVVKTASKIAYHDENNAPNLARAFPATIEKVWGFNVTAAMRSYAWFKLQLDDQAPVTKYDVPSSRQESASLQALPEGKTAVKVCSDFLTGLYEYTVIELNRLWGAEMMEATNIDFWFSVPAVWSDQVKAFTRKAAKDAGFASRRGDTLSLIPEPEAAAIATFSELTGEGVAGQLQKGAGVLVCDCGGGTVDITTYFITGVQPQLEFEELAVGIGSKAGSTFIDEAFHAWLSRTFGHSFDSIDYKKIGPGSRLMKEFESIKRNFGSSNPQDEYTISFLVPGALDSEHYDEEEREIKFGRDELEKFFKPSLDSIKLLLRDQLKSANKEMPHHQKVETIILVGGFGDSKYLYDELLVWCRENGGLRLLCPPNPQASIVKGACLRGLGELMPSRRRARRAYGFSCGMEFRTGKDPISRAYSCHWTFRQMCSGRMAWQINKGEFINEKTRKAFSLNKTYCANDSKKFTLELFACSEDHGPEYAGDKGITHLATFRYDFKGIPLDRFNMKYISGRLA